MYKRQIVAFIVLEVGFTFLKDAIGKIRQPEILKFNTVSVVILMFSIGVKIWLAFFNRKLGKKINSKVMMATAADAMGDAVSYTHLDVYKRQDVTLATAYQPEM